MGRMFTLKDSALLINAAATFAQRDFEDHVFPLGLEEDATGVAERFSAFLLAHDLQDRYAFALAIQKLLHGGKALAGTAIDLALGAPNATVHKKENKSDDQGDPDRSERAS